jgi:hypothetical protein
MPRPDARELLKALLSSLGFVAVGAFALWADAPKVIAWISLPLGGAGLVAILFRLRRPPLGSASSPLNDAGRGERVVLRDGRDYRVDVSDGEILLTQKSSGEIRRVQWSAVTHVFIIAIDAFPVGSMSFVVHHGKETLEIPTDSEGNPALLAAMQERLPGFDNEALIEASAMLHGFKRLWAQAPDNAT